MNVIGIIPARYASTRFPGKPLAMVQGKPMIQHVYERVSKMSHLCHAIVATDDKRIFDTVISFGGKVMMTANTHKSGTDRCGEVVKKLQEQGLHPDVVINIQGDEPSVEHTQIETLIKCFEDHSVQSATLKKKIRSNDELFSPNAVKVVCDTNDNALYFSRFALPYQRGSEQDLWLENHSYYKHIGIYSYRSETLLQLVNLKQSSLELCESLEQLRWLDNGFKIKVKETNHENIAIDTPEDLLKLKNISL
ncbi:MAG: 3-deoxy-manno-octulosonate cytidylyltransferase [Bacteroidales bacterium]|nr:3-deoxy-manno-octulosonate cytidylyltransferase [Bacteroidales bacterium]